MSSKPVYFIFGNHKHWTGMVWEWGEDTLANSTNALKRVIEETGLKGGLNFDGRGVEQLAVSHPESVATLKRLIKDKSIELWGGTYTQPYGGLIGHESNVKQRQFGIRAFEKILDERPLVFAEEEFDFFPQLPQVLSQLGYECALLFPQHTWHTPTFPMEDAETINWQGIDGTSLPTVPYSKRCLMRGFPTALATIRETNATTLITWLEMLDKPNWMWRTDFVIAHLKELQSQPDIDLKPILLRDYIQKTPPKITRSYSIDEYFHGISIGKNGDSLPRLWKTAEATILEAEFLASWCSFLGQPYPQFDAYPEWQLEEAWRNLCQSQGHDAYECEGFTNFTGHRYAQMAQMLAKDVVDRCKRHLAKADSMPFQTIPLPDAKFEILENGQLKCANLAEPVGLPKGWKSRGKPNRAERNEGSFYTTEIGSVHADGVLKWQLSEPGIAKGQLSLTLHERQAAGILNSVLLPIRLNSKITRWRVDSPFAVMDAHPNGEWPHKQPTGHWLTSPQREELIPKPITHLSFVCMETETEGLLYVSRQNMLAIAQDNGLDAVIYGYDAWDGDNWLRRATIDFAIIPVQNPTNAELLKIAHDVFHPRQKTFFELKGPAFVSGVRKVGEELEIRLFETEGRAGEANLRCLWPIETAKSVDLLANEITKIQSEGNELNLQLKPYDIVTLRILFKSKRTEYLDIDKHRSIWVGNQ